MREKIKALLAKMGVLPVIWFFRYGFRKNVTKLVNRIKGRIYKYKTLRWIFPREYNKYAKLPVEEDKIVFVEVRLPEVTNSFKVLYDELVSNYDFKVHAHFLRNTFVSRKEYVTRCKDMLRDIATAKYVFVNEASNVVSCVKLRPETIVTQLWHGCGAFKKFGFSTAELIFGESRKEMLKFPYYKNYKYVTVSSPEVTWAYEEAMNLKEFGGEVIATGSSRTDIFYDEQFKQRAFEKLHMLMPSSEGKKVILYAPTFRGRVAKAKTPSMLRVDMFKEAFEGEYVLLFKHHPLVRKPPAIAAADREFAQDFTNAMSIEELLCVADVCISDYSSLVFEYSLFEKPLIFFSYDLSEYFDWRGFYYDYFELAPGPIFTTNREMIDYIEHLDERFDKQRVADFRKKFMSACDGHATERIMDKVFGSALQKYKKANPVVDEYHMIPQAKLLFSQQEQLIEDLKWWHHKGNEYYQAAAKSPVTKGKIGVFKQEEGKDVLDTLVAHISLDKELSVVDLSRFLEDRKKLAEELAACETIVLTQASDIINALQIRKETRVVQAWNEILPIEKFGYSSKAYRGGLCKDYLDVAPMHYAYDLIPMAGEKLEPIYKEAFHVEKEGVCKPLGAIATDILFDKSFRKQAKAKLYELFPAAKDKKLIFYLPQYRIGKKRPSGEIFLDYGLMNEYLKDEYAIIYISPKSKHSKKSTLFPYYSNFICDMTGQMSVYECMVCADMMIGDYLAAVYTYAVLDKPIMMYAPDYKWYLLGRDTYFGYEEFAPGPVFENMEDLIYQLQHMDEYDQTRQKNFKKAFLTNCDGHAMDRLIKEIKQ